jgi:hypothetical protein
MPLIVRPLYYSSNGDRWLTAREAGSADVFIRHEPNPASGGRISHVSVAEFLAERPTGPQHEALLRLVENCLAALLEDDAPGG